MQKAHLSSCLRAGSETGPRSRRRSSPQPLPRHPLAPAAPGPRASPRRRPDRLRRRDVPGPLHRSRHLRREEVHPPRRPTADPVEHRRGRAARHRRPGGRQGHRHRRPHPAGPVDYPAGRRDHGDVAVLPTRLTHGLLRHADRAAPAAHAGHRTSAHPAGMQGRQLGGSMLSAATGDVFRLAATMQLGIYPVGEVAAVLAAAVMLLVISWPLGLDPGMGRRDLHDHPRHLRPRPRLPGPQVDEGLTDS